MLPEEFKVHLRAMSRLIYFVTDEEDQFLVGLREHLPKALDRTFVFNSTLGMKPIVDYIDDWTNQKHEEAKNLMDPTEVLLNIYRATSEKGCSHYIFLDPETIFKSDFLVRRLLNIVHEQANFIRTVKILIFVGPKRAIPERLARYIEVVYDKGLSGEEATSIVTEVVAQCNAKKNVVSMPADPVGMFRGMTSWEIKSSIAQSIAITKKSDDPDRRFQIDPEFVGGYRRRSIKKSEIVQYIDTNGFSFDQVGGVSRFKSWCTSMRAAWTPEGRRFGLRPPKGVLNVGVWGCGKSISVQAMGAAWNLPILLLEFGKLRQGEVGKSEGNVYQAINLLERMAPCLCWIDEAEKSLSGGQSSAHTDSGTLSRMIGILSTWLQETKAHVCLAMTANSISTLPIEIINRTDERFFFDVPAKKERIEILKILLWERGQNPDNFNLDRLAQASDQMVGREIFQAINSAMVSSFNASKSRLDEEIFTECLLRKPRLVRTMIDEIKSLKEWVGYDEASEDGIRARYASPVERKTGLRVVGGP